MHLTLLAERRAEKRGSDLPPGSFLSVNAPMSAEQRAQHISAAEDALADAYARLDPVRAWLVVGGLFPVLRPVADRFLENIAGQKPTETQDELCALALDILDQAIGGEFVGPQSEHSDA